MRDDAHIVLHQTKNPIKTYARWRQKNKSESSALTITDQSNPDRITRNLKIFLIIWTVLQLPRFIAIPLIGDVMAGTESPAWLYPAVLDVVVASSVPFIVYLLWKERSFRAWILTLVFYVVSIADHGGSISADILTATPQIFGGEDGPAPIVASGSQTIIDIVAVFVLTRSRMRDYFFKQIESA